MAYRYNAELIYPRCSDFKGDLPGLSSRRHKPCRFINTFLSQVCDDVSVYTSSKKIEQAIDNMHKALMLEL